MQESSDLQFDQNVYYSEEHTWARQDGEEIVIGISDYAQEQLGEIVFVELPEPGTMVEKNEIFGTVESVKTASELYMPISGTITQVNTALEDAPEIVNTEPFTEGWLIKVQPSEQSELPASLLNAEQYRQLVLEN